MLESMEHYRHIMLYHFHEKLTAAETARKICTVYGPDALKERLVQKWFTRFRAGNFDLKDAERSGRPSTVDDDIIKSVMDSDRHLTLREIAEITNVSHQIVAGHLKKIGYVQKADIWLPYQLTDKHMKRRVDACDLLLNKNDQHPFLRSLITGDESWILYKNSERKRLWGSKNSPPQTIAKPGLHPKKVLLCIWWDIKGVVHYELLPQNQTVTGDLYCSQLVRLKEAVEQKRPHLAYSL